MRMATSAVQVDAEVDGTHVPYKRVASCRTCRHPLRPQFEAALAQGRPYAEVAALHPRSGISARNLAEHRRRGHFSIDGPEVRAIVAKQAAENGRVARSAVRRQVAQRELAEAVVLRVWERLVQGELKPSLRDGIAAARYLGQFDPVVIERDLLRQRRDEGQARLAALFTIVNDLMGDDDWARFTRAVSDDLDLSPFLLLHAREQDRLRLRRAASRRATG